MSLQALVRSGDTDLSLQSLGSVSSLVWSGVADKNLQVLQSLCSRSVVLVLEHLHNIANLISKLIFYFL